MRHLGPMIVATAACALVLAGCNKQASTSQPTTSAEQPSTTPAPALSPEEMKKAQASLPAPYNTADLDNGQSKFALCQTCHTIVEGGPNMTGPNLHGVFGRKAASLPTFKYSDALTATGWTWDAQRIDTWITDPKAALAGTKMTFAGLKDPKDRTDVIAYLMINTGYKP